MNRAFVDFGERMWGQWLQNKLCLSSFIRSNFQTDCAPEPYLQFRESSNPLYVLTTNPGRGMPHQAYTAIASEASIISPSMSYQEASKKLAAYYENHLIGAAGRRVKGQIALAQRCGRNGVIQIESCPFHSESLPKKNRLLRQFGADPLLIEYASLFRAALIPQTVISVAAVSTLSPISIQSVTHRPWLAWQANAIGFDAATAAVLPLSRKAGKVTFAFVFSKTSRSTKGFLLMMGGNNMPAARHLQVIAQHL